MPIDKEDEMMLLQSILVAVDGGTQMGEVVDLAASVARTGGVGAVVHVLCVADVLAPALSALAPVTELTLDAAQGEAAAVVAGAVAQLDAAGIAAQGHIATGSSTQAIVGLAREQGCNLIVLGHRHMTLWRQLFDHSTCFDVLDLSPCPVLIATGGSV